MAPSDITGQIMSICELHRETLKLNGKGVRHRHIHICKTQQLASLCCL